MDCQVSQDSQYVSPSQEFDTIFHDIDIVKTEDSYTPNHAFETEEMAPPWVTTSTEGRIREKRKASQHLTVDDEDDSNNDDEISSALHARPKRNTVTGKITEIQECNLAEWLKQHPIFYNKKLWSYKDVVYKRSLLADKANELGIKPKELRVWMNGMRTRYGKLYKSRAGAGPIVEDMTERDAWIWSSFSFLEKFIGMTRMRRSRPSPLSTDIIKLRTAIAEPSQVVEGDKDVEVAKIDTPKSTKDNAATSPSTQHTFAQFTKQMKAQKAAARQQEEFNLPRNLKDVMVANYAAYVKAELDMLSVKSVLRFKCETTNLLVLLHENELRAAQGESTMPSSQTAQTSAVESQQYLSSAPAPNISQQQQVQQLQQRL